MSGFGHLLGVVIVSIGLGLLARYRTRNANKSNGCLACHADTLIHTDHDTLLCTSCGYEGDPEQGGHISYEEVRAFTGDRDNDEIY